MCGIVGIWDRSERTLPDEISLATQAIRHRGPHDFQVVKISPSFHLGHTRLAVIDPGGGDQPMLYWCRNDGWVDSPPMAPLYLAYNGEIYNYRELRKELESRFWFATNSDTEVLFTACVHWGVEETIQRVNGIFAFAIWDGRTKTLILARDRAGVKPLYYAQFGSKFMFASELKALYQFSAFEKRIDMDAVAQYMRFQYIPDPQTIYEGCKKLPPGCYLRVESDGIKDLKKYSQLPSYSPNLRVSFKDQSIMLDQVLYGAVERQLVSDIPVGLFLSGGIDSSLIAALAREIKPDIQAFTMGFPQHAKRGFDETDHADRIAHCLGFGPNHTLFTINDHVIPSILSRVARTFDEPFADSSAIPTFALSDATSKFVNVVLAGDGADELFGGYPRYRVNDMPFKTFIKKLPPGFVASGFRVARPFLPRALRFPDFRAKLEKLRVLTAQEAYLGLVGHFTTEEITSLIGRVPRSTLIKGFGVAAGNLDAANMMALEMETYLPGDLLTKVDRCAMAHGLEVRVPFLDNVVVDFASQIPVDMKINGAGGKMILKDILAAYIPQKLWDRPKQGFGVPLDVWLRGVLRGTVREYLSRGRIDSQGIFNPQVTEDLLNRFYELGDKSLKYKIYNLLMFQLWWEEWHSKGVNY